MTNSELKAYIKTNRNDESACHEAIKLLMSCRTENTLTAVCDQISYKINYLVGSRNKHFCGTLDHNLL